MNEWMNRIIPMKEIELIIILKNTPTKKIPRQDGISRGLYQRSEEELIPILHKFL